MTWRVLGEEAATSCCIGLQARRSHPASTCFDCRTIQWIWLATSDQPETTAPEECASGDGRRPAKFSAICQVKCRSVSQAECSPLCCLFSATANVPVTRQSPGVMTSGGGMIPRTLLGGRPLPFGVALVAAGDRLNGAGASPVSGADPKPQQQSIRGHGLPLSCATVSRTSSPCSTDGRTGRYRGPNPTE